MGMLVTFYVGTKVMLYFLTFEAMFIGVVALKFGCVAAYVPHP